MTETLPSLSSRKKLIMWYKIKELKSNGLRNSQISRETGLHRQTIAKYHRMSEDEFLASSSYKRYYTHKLDIYESFVLEELRNPAGLSSAQIEDHLRAKPEYDRSICSKTVFNYVQHIRNKYHIPRPHTEHFRQFEKQHETDFGQYAQVDFGERHMTRSDGLGSVKVYFFAMSLSRSRYKFILFSDKPFNSEWAVYAHKKGFEYFGGVPKSIIYDQDKVFLVSENYGDYIYTRNFGALVSEVGFTPIFCRKSDPQSKGQIENVVKYVKNNFLKGREYVDISTLNRQCLDWLSRTGNGSMHHGIHRIPLEVFKEEKDYLSPFVGTPQEPANELKAYKVRKDNTISYHCCFYSVPVGTYQGPSTAVFVGEEESQVIIYSMQTGKVLVKYQKSSDPGKHLSQGSMRRDRSGTVDELRHRFAERINATPEIERYLDNLQQRKSRYFRDTLSTLLKKSEQYSAPAICQAIEMCFQKDIYRFQLLLDAMETIRIRRGEDLQESSQTVHKDVLLEHDHASLCPEKSSMETYDSIFT